MHKTLQTEQQTQNMQTSMARKQRIMDNAYKAGLEKQNMKVTVVAKKDKVETLLTKAMDKLAEDDDDVKVMNQNVLQARVLDIRGKQIEENKQLERDWIHEQARLDAMMEIERLKALQEMEVKVERRKEIIYTGTSKIIDQIKEREVERIKQEEIKEKEAM